MRVVFYFTCLATIIISQSATTTYSQTLSKSDLEYYSKQTSTISKQIESYFDNEKPGYNSIERKNTLYLVDAITHNPKPHNDATKDLFFNRYKKALKSIKETKVNTGVAVWNIYNMSYVVKTPEITVAFDLVLLPDCMIKDGDKSTHEKNVSEIVELCDVFFVSHIHGDHADSFVAKEFLLQNKQVITHNGVFKNEEFKDKISYVLRDSKEQQIKVSGKGFELSFRIYPGHQAISADAAVDNNFTVVTFPNNITIAHSGDQSWNDDFTWLDSMSKDVDIDILMVNTWTADPDRLMVGLKPKVILPGHINEMDHGISGRISYWKSYGYWQNSGEKVVHLFWGEPYSYIRN